MNLAVVLRPPARWPAGVLLVALVLVLVLALSGCSLLQPAQTRSPSATADRTQVSPNAEIAQKDAKDAAADNRPTGAPARDAFSVEISGPEEVREYLERNLDLQRYRRLDDLKLPELSRLMVAAEPNARELLATLGYFTPTLTLELKDTPGGKLADHEILVTVEPGPLTTVGGVAIGFSGPISADTVPAGQRRSAISGSWSMPIGETFTQSRWDAAKSAGLRSLNGKSYPLGRIVDSHAQIDADRQTAALGLTFESGPAFRFGTLQIRGTQRYDAENGRRIAQLAVGEEYDQQKLLNAQQRLASSGYYESVFLTLDTDGTDPQKVPVIAQVREAELQKVVFGAGYTTDSGPRLSVDHTHNKLPLLDWRAVSRLSLDGKTQSIKTALAGLLDNDSWRWFGAGQLQREQSGSFDVTSGRVRYGRSKSNDHIDRSYFGQYDYAINSGTDAPPSASTVSANWGWTGRYFDDFSRPRRGQGVALEVAAGTTLLGGQHPFTRTVVRWLGLVPLYQVDASAGPINNRTRHARLQLRAEAGAVLASDAARIPATQLFLTGGDTTVRGFGYRKIGSVDAHNATVAGRFLAVASAELQHPIVYGGQLTELEAVAFVDTGAVADRTRDLKARVGAGVGVRWNSPVGLVQGDLAHGFGTGGVTVHVRLGFTF